MQILTLLVLLVLSAFFAGSETALMSVSRIRLKNLVENQVPNANIISKFLENPGRLLSTLLIGNNVVNIVASSIATVLFISLLGDGYGPLIAVVVLTTMILIFGEIVPKTLASHSAERWSLKVAKPISTLMAVLSPLVYILTKITNMVIKITGTTTKGRTVTPEEIKTVIHLGQSEGAIEVSEREMLTSVLEFNDTIVREIMIPRIDIYALEDSITVEQAARMAVKTLHSRIPVYQQTVDNIVGLVHVKDLLVAILEDADKTLGEIMRQVYFAPESQQIGQLLEQMRAVKVSMAIILDEYGATSGMVTIEDIVEEIVGEIEDEYDLEEPTMETLAEGETLLDGGCPIYEVNQQLSLNLPESLADTIGGYIFFKLGHIPSPGDRLVQSNLIFTVEEMDGRRIAKVRAHKK